MIKIEHSEVVGWEHAIRGMRNPMNSWDKGDTRKTTSISQEDIVIYEDYDGFFNFVIGPKDQALMNNLSKLGTDHRKFMRMIAVYMDITAPLYWWKEFDTYKVGTVANSCSTMHKLMEKEFSIDDFSHDHLSDYDLNIITDNPYEHRVTYCGGETSLKRTVDLLNYYRTTYLIIKSMSPSSIIAVIGPNRWNDVPGSDNEEKKEALAKRYWCMIIQLLPTSYNQKRTVMMNYEVLANIYNSRKNHKLDEWRIFCEEVKRSLPYSSLFTKGE